MQRAGTGLQWLSNAEDLGQVVDAAIPSQVEFDRRLTLLLGPSADFEPGLREPKILRACLAGAAILRSATEAEGADSILVNMDDYGFVRSLLVSPIVKPNHDLCDPLAADMISRANVYLSIKYGGRSQNSFAACDDAVNGLRGNFTRRKIITRRELADLGDTAGEFLGRLIEHLQRSDEGYDLYLRMALVGKPILRQNWRQASAGDLARQLRGRSVKQIRTRFDVLRQRRLITAQRESGNRPWRYEIPEQLGQVTSPFAHLPTVRQLQHRHAA